MSTGARQIYRGHTIEHQRAGLFAIYDPTGKLVGTANTDEQALSAVDAIKRATIVNKPVTK